MGRESGISENRVLQVLRDRDRTKEPVLGTTIIADRLGVSQPTAKDRLDRLAEEGAVKKQTYGRSMLFWPADERMTDEADPISGGLAEEVEAIAEAKGEPRATTVRRLVELGLEAEEADVRPNELKAEYDTVEEKAERNQQKAERMFEYAVAGGAVTAGLLIVFAAIALPATPFATLPFGSTLIAGLQTLGSLTTLAGFVAWIWALIKPTVMDIRD